MPTKFLPRRWALRCLAVSLMTLTIGIQTNSLAKTNGAKLPLVFLLHGYVGSPTSFCDFEQILKNRFPGQIHVKSLSYSSMGPVVSANRDPKSPDHILARDRRVKDFNAQIQSQIRKAFSDYGEDQEQQYTIIAHSQGGQVLANWYNDCVIKDSPSCKTRGFRPRNLRLAVTLGTPYFGSAIATKLTSTTYRRTLLENLTEVMPFAQLRELSYGSASVWKNEQMLEPIYDRVLAGSTRFVQVAADVAKSGFAYAVGAADLLPRGNFWDPESDEVVSLVSAHSRALRSDGNQRRFQKLGDSIYFYPVLGTHTSGKGAIACPQMDLAPFHIPSQIVNFHIADFVLKAPPLKTERKALLEEKNFSQNISSFMAFVKVKLPKSFTSKYPGSHVLFSEKDASFSSADTDLIREIDGQDQATAKFSGLNDDGQTSGNEITWFTTGRFRNVAASFFDPQHPFLSNQIRSTLEAEINSPWFEGTSSEIEVGPGYSSVLEIQAKTRTFDVRTCFEGVTRIVWDIKGKIPQKLKLFSDRELTQFSQFVPLNYPIKVDQYEDGVVRVQLSRGKRGGFMNQHQYIEADNIRLIRPCRLEISN